MSSLKMSCGAVRLCLKTPSAVTTEDIVIGVCLETECLLAVYEPTDNRSPWVDFPTSFYLASTNVLDVPSCSASARIEYIITTQYSVDAFLIGHALDAKGEEIPVYITRKRNTRYLRVAQTQSGACYTLEGTKKLLDAWVTNLCIRSQMQSIALKKENVWIKPNGDKFKSYADLREYVEEKTGRKFYEDVAQNANMFPEFAFYDHCIKQG